jgi:hypothetical protein
MEPAGSLPQSKEPAFCPFLESYQSSLCPLSPPSTLSKINFNTILPSTSGSSKWSFFFQVSAPKPCMHLSSLQYVLHAPPISFFLTWSPVLRILNGNIYVLALPTFRADNKNHFRSMISSLCTLEINLKTVTDRVPETRRFYFWHWATGGMCQWNGF